MWGVVGGRIQFKSELCTIVLDVFWNDHGAQEINPFAVDKMKTMCRNADCATLSCQF